jgi:SWI/SNF-related matrix-associated actin-dependent regulator 1 of chromatin subfamily A
VKNPKSQRAKLVMALRKRCTRVVALTGTPILNRPIELWPILQLVAPEYWDPAGLKSQQIVGVGEGAGFFRYAKRYCDAKKEWHGRASHWDFSGASNLPELQEKLRQSCMVRRLKADVLTELPPKRRQVIALNRNGSADAADAEWEALGDARAELEAYGDIEKMKKGIAFEDISRARKDLAISKVDAVIEHVRECFESSDKIILFAHHHEVIGRLQDELRDYNPAVITGLTPAALRQGEVEKFQENPECRLFIGSIGAAGVGITLTASSHVIFAEIDWTPAMMSQAEDRAHRIGQLESVLVQVLVVEGSLDARMIELIQHKQMVADLGLDTETLVDVTGEREIVETVSERHARELRELALTWEQVQLVHDQLRYLAALCDGATARDGCGFNKLDSGIGKSLAARERLSPKQALLGQKIVGKYKRQLTREGF